MHISAHFDVRSFFPAGGRQLEQLHPKNKAQKPNDKPQNKPRWLPASCSAKNVLQKGAGSELCTKRLSLQ